jgi:hypothetical protein
MTNALYTKAREGFLGGDIDWDGDAIKVVLVDTNDYTPNIEVDDTLSDIPVAARVATSGNLTSKTISNGVADAADVTLASVTGDPAEALVIYQDTGDPATARLIAFIDEATGLPVTPDGSDVTITWDGGPNRIFRI